MKLDDRLKKADPIYGIFLAGWIYKKNLELAINLTKPYSNVVLDVGFGYGVLFPYLINYTRSCYGINIKSDQSNKARRVLNSLGIEPHLITGDIRKAPFPDSVFDVIYAINTLEHVKEICLALGEIKRILRQGGILVVAAPTENWVYKVGRMAIGSKKPKDHYHTASDIKGELLYYFDMTAEKLILPMLPLFRVYLCKKS
jgi:ubiquinone/menaquinone biosynthesis C-methylase UbiE